MKILEFNRSKAVLLITIGIWVSGLIGCKPEKNDLILLADYIQENDLQTASDFDCLPVFISWEKKTDKYWIGEALISQSGNEQDSCRVLALFEQNRLIKLQFSHDIPESNNQMLAIYEIFQAKSGDLIKANLNSAIYPYKVWEFNGSKPFWLQIGQSFGARSGTEFYCFYFSLDYLVGNL